MGGGGERGASREKETEAEEEREENKKQGPGLVYTRETGTTKSIECVCVRQDELTTRSQPHR